MAKSEDYGTGYYEDRFYESIARKIPTHRKNAIKAKALAAEIGCDERTVRRYVQELRERGYWVCSGDYGYFIATDPKETEHFVRRIYDHAIMELKAIKHMRKALKEEGIKL